MDLLLVRHAQTHSNVARALDTALPGADLTELGEQQVAELARSLAEVDIDAVYSSPALRARRTAEGLATPRDLDVVLRPALVEISAGDWEMSTAEDHWVGYGQMLGGWFDGDLDHQLPGGESGHHAIGRLDEVVAEVAALGLDRVALVSHGGLLRAWCVARVGNVGPELGRSHPLPNTGVVALTGDPDGWTATRWADLVLESAT